MSLGPADQTDRGMREAQATITYQKEIDARMRQMFPTVDTMADLDEVKEKDAIFFSFDAINRSIVQQQALIYAFSQASDPEAESYAQHAADKHATFEEVIGLFVADIAANNYEIMPERFHIEVEVVDEKKGTRNPNYKVLVDRFLIHGQEFVRETGFPPPRLAQEEIFSGRMDKTGQLKVARRAVRDEGVAFGILMMAYHTLTPEGIFDFFNNKDFVKSLGAAKVPTPRRPEDVEMLRQICDLLTMKGAKQLLPSPSPDMYRQALQLLAENDYDVSEELVRFQATRRRVRPFAVLRGATHKAQKVASKKYLDNARSTYIDREHGRYATTEFATIYLQELGPAD